EPRGGLVVIRTVLDRALGDLERFLETGGPIGVAQEPRGLELESRLLQRCDRRRIMRLLPGAGPRLGGDGARQESRRQHRDREAAPAFEPRHGPCLRAHGITAGSGSPARSPAGRPWRSRRYGWGSEWRARPRREPSAG